LKFKCACPKPVCDPCNLPHYGYFATCWRPWPWPHDWSHCPVPPPGALVPMPPPAPPPPRTTVTSVTTPGGPSKPRETPEPPEEGPPPRKPGSDGPSIE